MKSKRASDGGRTVDLVHSDNLRLGWIRSKSARKIQILVSILVIELGHGVPNAVTEPSNSISMAEAPAKVLL